MTRPQSDCPTFEQIDAALDCTLEEPQRGQVLQHLESCRVCAARGKEAGDLRAVAEMLARFQLSDRERERIRTWQAAVNAQRTRVTGSADDTPA